MNAVVECEGAPRDLGLDQGLACRDAVARRFAGAPLCERLRSRAGWPGEGESRSFRDLWQYFPHQADRLEGLGGAAGVPATWLAPRVPGPGHVEPALVGYAAPTARIGRALGGPVVVRRSRPEGLFASVEVTRPWFPAALVGVNERGLAVAAVAGPAEAARCAAPAWLLAQDCLERFEALGPALDWCCERPGGGGGALILAHPVEGMAGVVFGATRRVLRGDPSIVRGGATAGSPDAVPAEAGSLARALGGAAVDVGAGCLHVGEQVFNP
ncbi:MAG: hypothetical protein VX546_09380 [Myxococcota bacterium]|nr:hypothetical protein [Myxococcota bacterium]